MPTYASATNVHAIYIIRAFIVWMFEHKFKLYLSLERHPFSRIFQKKKKTVCVHRLTGNRKYSIVINWNWKFVVKFDSWNIQNGISSSMIALRKIVCPIKVRCTWNIHCVNHSYFVKIKVHFQVLWFSMSPVWTTANDCRLQVNAFV